MTLRPTDHDLLALALGRLDPAARERVERALLADPARQREYEAMARHLRRYDALPPAPGPPPLARVRAALPEAPRRTRAARLAWALPLGVLVLVALLLGIDAGRDRGARGVARAGPGLAVDGGATLVEEAEAVPAGALLDAGAVPAEAWVGGRTHLVLDAGSRVGLRSAGHVDVLRGRVWFEVRDGPFRVGTPWETVEVRGTEFEVRILEDGLEVGVAAGRVRVGDRLLGEGQRFASGRIEARSGVLGDWFRRPRLALQGPSRVRAGEEVALRLVLENPSMVPLEVAGPGGLRAAFWLEVRDPTGAVHDLPVPASNRPEGAVPTGPVLRFGPREQRVVTASLREPFGLPGVYACRAMYRPEDGAPVLSPPWVIEVR